VVNNCSIWYFHCPWNIFSNINCKVFAPFLLPSQLLWEFYTWFSYIQRKSISSQWLQLITILFLIRFQQWRMKWLKRRPKGNSVKNIPENIVGVKNKIFLCFTNKFHFFFLAVLWFELTTSHLLCRNCLSHTFKPNKFHFCKSFLGKMTLNTEVLCKKLFIKTIFMEMGNWGQPKHV
jgi:hypothetical protein